MNFSNGRGRIFRFLTGTLAMLAICAGRVSAQEAPPAAVPVPAVTETKFIVTPSKWELGEIDGDRVFTASFQIESPADPQVRFSFNRASTPLIQCQLIPLTGKDKVTWQLTGQLSTGQLAAAEYSEFIMITTTDPKTPLIKLPVTFKVRQGKTWNGAFFYSTKASTVDKVMERLAAIGKKRELEIPSLYSGDEASFVQQVQLEQQFRIQQGNQVEFFCAGRAFLGLGEIEYALKALEGEEKDWQKAVQASFDEIKKLYEQQAKANGTPGGQGSPDGAAPTTASSPSFTTEVQPVTASGPKLPSTAAPVLAVKSAAPAPAPASASSNGDMNPMLTLGIILIVGIMLYNSFLLNQVISRIGK